MNSLLAVAVLIAIFIMFAISFVQIQSVYAFRSQPGGKLGDKAEEIKNNPSLPQFAKDKISSNLDSAKDKVIKIINVGAERIEHPCDGCGQKIELHLQ